MSDARVIVEIAPPADAYTRRLLNSLKRTFDYHCPGISSAIEPRHEFDIHPTFELGVEAVVRNSVEIAAKGALWNIYLAPRKFQFIVNGSHCLDVAGVLMAVSIQADPVALYLGTVTTSDIPVFIEENIEVKVKRARNQLLHTVLSPAEELVVEGMRNAVVNAYVGALTQTTLNG